MFIDGIVENSAADAAGLKQGDVILEADGKEVNSANQLQSFIARKRVGDEVKLTIFRFGEVFDKSVMLKARTDNSRLLGRNNRESTNNRPGKEGENKTMDVTALGMEVGPLSSREKRERDVDHGVGVRGIEIYGEAFTQGVRDGDIVLSVNRKKVKSPKDFEKIVSDVDSGDVVLLEIQRANGTKSLVALEVQ